MLERQTGATWGSQVDTRRAQRVALLAEAQRGVVSLLQLQQCGVSATTVRRWAADGRLHRVLRGVYAVGHPVLTREGWWLAAALACGPGAVIAARSALAVYGLTSATTTIDVIGRHRKGAALPGIRIHRCDLAPAEHTTWRGIPITTVSRAFLDSAPRLAPDRLTMALNDALHLGRYDHAEMMATIDRHPGHRGVRALREAVAVLGDDAIRFRSRDEVRARELIVVAGLTVPEVNAWVPTRAGHGHELDLYWRTRRLNVEVDGPRHELPWHRRADALRDDDLRATGIRVERFPTALIDADPRRFVARVAALLA